MRVANAHKGKAGYACVVSGLACHSALNHQGVNALEIAAEIIVRLRRRNLEFRARGPFQEGFDPPHCTVTTSVIGAGTALNIVPDACRFEFEFRTLPGQDAAALLAEIQAFAEGELLPEMRARHPGATIAWQELMSYPALGGADGSAFERLCCAAAGADAPGQGAVRHRGRTVRGARDRERGLRPRRHDASPTSRTNMSSAPIWTAAQPSCAGWSRRRWRPER